MFETNVFIRNDRYLDSVDFIDREATLYFWRENRVSKIYVCNSDCSQNDLSFWKLDLGRTCDRTIIRFIYFWAIEPPPI